MSFFNLLPEKVLRTQNQDGSTTRSELYTWDADVNRQMYPILTLLVVGIVFAPFLSTLLLVMYCWEIQRNPIHFNILAIVVSIYLLVDINHGWFLSMIMDWSTSHNIIVKIVYLNGAMILLNLIVIFVGSTIYKAVSLRIEPIPNPDEPDENSTLIKFACAGIIALMFVGCYFVSMIIFSNNLIKIF